jgi:RNA polymerase sigma factor (sigma-70 family)
MGFVEFHNASDKHIWDKFREGNPSAFEIMYERNINVLANYGKRMCSDTDLVKDAIQDMFIDLWRNHANLSSTDSIKYYLIKAFRRNLIKKINSAKKLDAHNENSSFFDGTFELSHELVMVESEIESEKLDLLNSMLNNLPPRQKEAVFLRFYGGLNYTEISDAMGINQQSAHNMVFRALEVLRDKMSYNYSGLLLILRLAGI